MPSYAFEIGTYRVRVRSTYKRDDMSMTDATFSNEYRFYSSKERKPIFYEEVFTSNTKDTDFITDPFYEVSFTGNVKKTSEISDPFYEEV